MFKKTLLTTLIVTGIAISFYDAKVAASEQGQALSVSPPTLQLTADPGETVRSTIKLTNIANNDITVESATNNFTAKDESGVPSIVFDESNTQNLYTLKDWITVEKTVSLGSGKSKEFNFSITVPQNAEPGGHYAVLRFSNVNDEIEQGAVGINASIGSLILLTVNGEVQNESKLADFYSSTQNYQKSAFFEQGPIGFVVRINNTGNIHNTPTGTITVYNMFDSKVGELRVNGNPDDTYNKPGNILPQSIRRFEQMLETDWMLGRYKADLNLTYNNGQLIQSTITFWVIPYKLVLGAIIGAAVLITLIVIGVKKYNRYITKKARGNEFRIK